MTTITPPAYVTQSEEQYDKAFDPRIARRMADFIRPYNWRVFVALLFMAAASAAAVAGPYFVKVALDNGLTAGNLPVLRQTVIAFVIVSLIQWVCTYYRVKHMAVVGQAVIYDLRKALFDHLQKLSLSFYSRYSVGRVITRVINDVEVLRDFLTWGMLAILRDVFVLIGIIIAMLSMNLRLSLITFTVLPLMALAHCASQLSQGARRDFLGQFRACRKHQCSSRRAGLFTPTDQL
jgi:ABC-type bacteriocin/lantibiotic exporter with double-glycine peptidase domain